MSNGRDEKSGYEMVLDFDLDNPDFTESEVLTFCLGFEFGNLYSYLRYNPTAMYDGWIHPENAARLTALCKRMGRKCAVIEPGGDWSYLEVEPAAD